MQAIPAGTLTIRSINQIGPYDICNRESGQRYHLDIIHTVVHSGYRWHARVWCEKSGDFRDFVLSRISETPGITLPATHGAEMGDAWNTRVTVVLVPDPRLTTAQQAVIAQDYGMRDGQLAIPTRGALVSYALQQLRVDSAAEDRPPEAQQVVIGNRSDVEPWLIQSRS